MLSPLDWLLAKQFESFVDAHLGMMAFINMEIGLGEETSSILKFKEREVNKLLNSLKID